MVYTVRDLITDALQEIGVKDPVEPLEDEDADTGLKKLTLMADVFQADGALLFTAKRVSFPLVSNQASNTLGIGGDFDTAAALGASTPRPMLIGLSTVTPVGEVFDYPLTPYVSRDDYYAEPLKTLTELYPRRFLYEPEWPLGRLTWWPVPTTAAVVNLALPVPLTSPATLDTVLTMPPAYLEAWMLNLALRCCRPFRKKVSAELRDDARLALGLIRRGNEAAPPLARCDGYGRGGYDIRSNRSGSHA